MGRKEERKEKGCKEKKVWRKEGRKQEERLKGYWNEGTSLSGERMNTHNMIIRTQVNNNEMLREPQRAASRKAEQSRDGLMDDD